MHHPERCILKDGDVRRSGRPTRLLFPKLIAALLVPISRVRISSAPHGSAVASCSYTAFYESVSREGAQARCEALPGSMLAEPLTQLALAQREKLHSLFDDWCDCLGATDEAIEGTIHRGLPRASR